VNTLLPLRMKLPASASGLKSTSIERFDQSGITLISSPRRTHPSLLIVCVSVTSYE